MAWFQLFGENIRINTIFYLSANLLSVFTKSQQFTTCTCKCTIMYYNELVIYQFILCITHVNNICKKYVLYLAVNITFTML